MKKREFSSLSCGTDVKNRKMQRNRAVLSHLETKIRIKRTLGECCGLGCLLSMNLNYIVVDKGDL